MKQAIRLALGVLILGLLGSGPAAAQALDGLKPTAVAQDELAPGLAVTYWRGNRFDLMVEMHDLVKRAKGRPGDPVLQLDTGRHVLSTKGSQLVAAVMKGYINFADPGVYQVEFVSNDGFMIEIDGKLIHSDPNRHSDSTSGPIALEISEGGWYDVDIAYFQKKGTHRHEMYWLPPGQDGDLTIVPAEAYAHSPGTTPGAETMPVPDPRDTYVR